MWDLGLERPLKSQKNGKAETEYQQYCAGDPACAGLKMMATSFILALFVLAFYQRKTGVSASFLKVSCILALTIILNVLANLLRIVLLVLFKMLPENIFHGLIWMACLVLYVVIPLLFIAARIFQNGPQSNLKSDQHLPEKSVGNLTLTFNFLLLVATDLIGLKTTETKAAIARSEANLTLPGYQKEVLIEGITKFENAEALVYVKPVRFYAAEHNPMVCWTGSGYTFQHINKQVVYGKEIYTGILHKGKDKLYSDWWFDKGNLKTINQLDWR